MNIGVFGATGTIGGCVVTEAVSRGHRVTAFTRDTARIPAETGAVHWNVVNVLDSKDVARAIEGFDVVVNAINSGNNTADMIANAGVLLAAARTLLAALARCPATRVIVVGGGASLEVSPGLQALDVEGFADALLSSLQLPAEYMNVLLAHREAMNIYRLSDRYWTYLSPSAGAITRGQRTGRSRIGGDQLLVSLDGGVSDMSAEDVAVAVVDEAELPRHIQRRFTVGY